MHIFSANIFAYIRKKSYLCTIKIRDKQPNQQPKKLQDYGITCKLSDCLWNNQSEK